MRLYFSVKFNKSLVIFRSQKEHYYIKYVFTQGILVLLWFNLFSPTFNLFIEHWCLIILLPFYTSNRLLEAWRCLDETFSSVLNNKPLFSFREEDGHHETANQTDDGRLQGTCVWFNFEDNSTLFLFLMQCFCFAD